jgi:hypothetical protein
MKKLIILLLVIIGLWSCKKETPCTITDDIDQLKQTKSEYQNEIRNFVEIRGKIVHEIDSLTAVLKIIDIYKSGRIPQYILKIHLKQSHITLDLGKVIKDHMNTVDFELPVDKLFYDQVQVGTSIVDDFRMGSFILSGSIGSWDMTVSGKEIR